jgi:hypothetical protein
LIEGHYPKLTLVVIVEGLPDLPQESLADAKLELADLVEWQASGFIKEAVAYLDDVAKGEGRAAERARLLLKRLE